MTRIKPTTPLRRNACRFSERFKSSRKGIRNCTTIKAAPSQPQEVLKRGRYQGISSVKLPDQTISNCEKEKYAQIMTIMRSSLPKSWKGSGLRTRDMGSRRDSSAIVMITNASAVRPSPATNRKPHIVEYHSVCSDSAQSTEANVMVKT